MPSIDVPISSNRTFVDWEAERRTARISDPWIRGSQAAWEASRPAGWIRWVDLFPAGARDLLSGVRRQRVELESARVEARLAAIAERERNKEKREHRREIDRASWARRRLRMYGTKTKEELAAEREAKKAATRTEEQKKRHENYMRRQDERKKKALDRYYEKLNRREEA